MFCDERNAEDGEEEGRDKEEEDVAGKLGHQLVEGELVEDAGTVNKEPEEGEGKRRFDNIVL